MILVLSSNFTKELSYFHVCDKSNALTAFTLSKQGPQLEQIFCLQMERGTFSSMPSMKGGLGGYE